MQELLVDLGKASYNQNRAIIINIAALVQRTNFGNFTIIDIGEYAIVKRNANESLHIRCYDMRGNYEEIWWDIVLTYSFAHVKRLNGINNFTGVRCF